MRGLALAAVVVSASSSSKAADLVFDLGAGYVLSPNSTHGYGFRASAGLDFGILEPAILALWCPGSDPGLFGLTHVNQPGAQVLYGVAPMLRLHTPTPHQAGLGIGVGVGRMVAAQTAGADANGYRATAGAYTVIEVGYRYSAGPVTVGATVTTHLFTHVLAVGDFGRGTGQQLHEGFMVFESFIASLGLRTGLF